MLEADITRGFELYGKSIDSDSILNAPLKALGYISIKELDPALAEKIRPQLEKELKVNKSAHMAKIVKLLVKAIKPVVIALLVAARAGDKSLLGKAVSDGLKPLRDYRSKQPNIERARKVNAGVGVLSRNWSKIAKATRSQGR